MGVLFGTDGVRGIANEDLSCELAMKIGRATAKVLSGISEKRPTILIGKDTRVSSDMLESAISAGICSVGADVMLLGIIPTPAVAYLVKKYGATAGIVISASHNTVEFNGIKIFNSEGFKLADELENKIEELITNMYDAIELCANGGIGRVYRSITAEKDYVDHLFECAGCDLSDLRIAVDCANGASYKTAKEFFARSRAELFFTADNPDGTNINRGVGSTHLDNISRTVLENRCDIGVAFDGDADRCLAVDENGDEIDGDKIIAVFAKTLKDEGSLKGGAAVVTVMTNLGFVNYCDGFGVKTVRTSVGDRYVLEEMLKSGYNLGGEQSGHIIQLDYGTTGDGELTAAKLLSILAKDGCKASELVNEIKKFPQILVNVSADKEQREFYKTDIVSTDYIYKCEAGLNNGRVLVRVSGTEPLIRIMVEGENLEEIESVAGDIARFVESRISR